MVGFNRPCVSCILIHALHMCVMMCFGHIAPLPFIVILAVVFLIPNSPSISCHSFSLLDSAHERNTQYLSSLILAPYDMILLVFFCD